VCRRPLDKRHGGLWEFPGGKCELGESDAESAERELREELNVRLIGASHAVFEIADSGSPFVIAFVPVQIEGDPSCIEHVDLSWRHPQELLELPLAPSDRAFVEFLVRSGNERTDA
jgi:8-oxo-dGTP pyrophosphatase MutT (NUDIX family)